MKGHDDGFEPLAFRNENRPSDADMQRLVRLENASPLFM